jgi:hypothetical protein
MRYPIVHICKSCKAFTNKHYRIWLSKHTHTYTHHTTPLAAAAEIFSWPCRPSKRRTQNQNQNLCEAGDSWMKKQQQQQMIYSRHAGQQLLKWADNFLLTTRCASPSYSSSIAITKDCLPPIMQALRGVNRT